MNRISLLIVFLILVAFYGCKSDKNNENYTYDEIPDLKASVVLYPYKNTILTQNYFPDLSELDSVRYSMPKYFNISSDFKEIYLNIDFDSVNALTELKFWSNGYCYSIVCKKAPLVKATFTTEVIKNNSYNKVVLTGDFNNWNKDELPMIYQGYSWTQYLYLEPGFYEYRIIGDGKYTLPSLKVKDSVLNSDGSYNFVKQIVDKSDKAPIINFKSVTDDKLCIRSTQGLMEYFILWQNMRLPIDLANVDGLDYYIPIPAVAQKLQISYIRVCGFNKNGTTNELVIPLSNGKVANSTAEVNSTFHHNLIMLLSATDDISANNVNTWISSGILKKTAINSVCLIDNCLSEQYTFSKIPKIIDKTPELFPFTSIDKLLGKSQPLNNLNETSKKSGIPVFYAKGLSEIYFDKRLSAFAQGVFANDSLSFEILKDALKYSMRNNGDLHLLGNLVGNPLTPDFSENIYIMKSDTSVVGPSEQQMSEYIHKKWLQYIAFQLTIPGVPCLEWGDNASMLLNAIADIEKSGLTGFGKVQVQKYIKLLELHKKNIAFLYGETKILECNKSYLVIQRKYLSNVVIVAFNKTPYTQMIGVNLTDISNQTRFTGNFEALNKQEEFYVRMEIPAYGFEILTSKN